MEPQRQSFCSSDQCVIVFAMDLIFVCPPPSNSYFESKLQSDGIRREGLSLGGNQVISVVNFKNIIASYITSKTEFIQKQQRNCNPGYVNHGRAQANPGNGEGELAFIGERWELGGAVVTKESTGVQSMEAFYSLGCHCLRLAGLSWGREFSSSYWMVEAPSCWKYRQKSLPS